MNLKKAILAVMSGRPQGRSRGRKLGTGLGNVPCDAAYRETAIRHGSALATLEKS